MTYVGDRRVIDADSHLMEWPGFLTDHADRAIRERLPPITGGLSKGGRHARRPHRGRAGRTSRLSATS